MKKILCTMMALYGLFNLETYAGMDAKPLEDSTQDKRVSGKIVATFPSYGVFFQSDTQKIGFLAKKNFPHVFHELEIGTNLQNVQFSLGNCIALNLCHFTTAEKEQLTPFFDINAPQIILTRIEDFSFSKGAGYIEPYNPSKKSHRIKFYDGTTGHYACSDLGQSKGFVIQNAILNSKGDVIRIAATAVQFPLPPKKDDEINEQYTRLLARDKCLTQTLEGMDVKFAVLEKKEKELIKLLNDIESPLETWVTMEEYKNIRVKLFLLDQEYETRKSMAKRVEKKLNQVRSHLLNPFI